MDHFSFGSSKSHSASSYEQKRVLRKQKEKDKKAKEVKNELEERKKKEKEDKEKQPKQKVKSPFESFQSAYKIGFGIGKYITKNFLSAVLPYRAPLRAKQLSSLENQKEEMDKNKQGQKIIPVEKGGPTKEYIYATALKLATELGYEKVDAALQPYPKENSSIEVTQEVSQKETVFEKNASETGIPLFITKKLEAELKALGVLDEEIMKLKPREAWDLLQRKTLEKELKDEPPQKVYTPDQASKEFALLRELWDEAVDRMYERSDADTTSRLLAEAAKTFDDPIPLQTYLEKEGSNLNPEEKFFLEISIEIKRFRQKAKELLYGEEGA
jgi:hypothetical protein